MGDREFYAKACRLAIPIALQNLITIGVNMMDTVMLGTLGETAISASSLANQFITIYHIACMGIGMGASVMVSRFWGMNDKESLKKSITIMLRFCISFGILFMVLTALFPRQIMRIYTPDSQIIYEGTRYFFWMVPTYLLLGLILDVAIVLRSVGKAYVPLISAIAGFSSNVFFNWIFIFGKLGAPKMGVAGAALGTFLARLIECAAVLGYFLLADKDIAYSLKDLFADCKDLTGEYLRICIPVVISDSLMAFGNTAVAIIMGHIGASFVSANSITAITQQLTTVLTQGISQASCIMTGHTLGEGAVERARREGYTFMIFGAILGVIACGIILLVSRPVVGMYRITEETRMIAYQLMDAIAIIVIFQSTNSILTKGVLRGGGDTRFLMIADVLFLWVASVPLGVLAGLVLHLPAFWIYFFMKIDQILKCVWAVFRLRSGKWIKRIG